MKRIALFVLLCPYVYAQEAGIEGIAINSITRQPLAGVHVTIYGFRGNAPPVESYGVTSAAMDIFPSLP